jgi:DNA-binding Lrp family transcriptional regulator
MEYKLPNKPKIKEKVIQPDQRRFCVVPLRAIIENKLTIQKLRVLCLLASYCNKAGFTYVSLNRLANDMGLKQAALSYHIRGLEKLGYIKQFPGYHTMIKGKTKRIIYDENISDREAEQVAGVPKEAHTRAEIKALYAHKRISNNKDITDSYITPSSKQSSLKRNELITSCLECVTNEQDLAEVTKQIEAGADLEELYKRLNS